MTSSARIRRMHYRRARGIKLVAPVEVSEGLLEALLHKRLLPPDRATDRAAVGAAIAELLGRWEKKVDAAHPRMFDTKRTIWVISDVAGARFMQDGRYFDGSGREVRPPRSGIPEI